MVLEKSAELARALVESPEYIDFMAARADANNDAVASKLINEYGSKRMEYESLVEGDVLPPEEKLESMRDDLARLGEELNANAKIVELTRTQNAFQNLMTQVNDIIGAHINPQHSHSCGGGCSDCSSCDSGCDCH